jgi:hypothetical protein
MQTVLSLFFFALTFAIAACAQLSAPGIGNVRYSDGSVRAVYGIDANLVIGPELLSASAASFSAAGGLIANDQKIILLSPGGIPVAEYPAAERNPLLDIGATPETAIAYLPSSQSLVWWNGQTFQQTSLAGALPGVPVSIQSDGTLAVLYLCLSDENIARASVSLANGEIRSWEPVPGARGFAFAQAGFLLSNSGGLLVVESPSGNVETLKIPASGLVIERMSAAWLHLFSPATAGNWVLHLSTSVCRLSLLPAAPAIVTPPSEVAHE